MPVHDWTRVDAGTFHHFHLAWIAEVSCALNHDLLPSDYYAMIERLAIKRSAITTHAATETAGNGSAPATPQSGGPGLLLAPPRVRLTGETELDFYLRKQSSVAVRHVSGDRIVAIVEIVSPGNKSSTRAIRALIDKAAELLSQGIHLLIIDLFPPGPRDPAGLHALLWEEISGQTCAMPADRPLTLAAYESDLALRYYVEPVAVDEALTDMPLFLEPRAHVLVPLEATYQSAFEAVPRRWRMVLEGR